MVDHQLREETKTIVVNGEFVDIKVWKDRNGNEFEKDEHGKFVMVARAKKPKKPNDNITRVSDVRKEDNFGMPNLNDLFARGPPPILEKDKDHPATDDNGNFTLSDELKKELEEEAERAQREWDEQHGGDEVFALLSIVFLVIFVFYIGTVLSMVIKRIFPSKKPQYMISKPPKRKARKAKAVKAN